ncbi:MAG: DJ-1/PfpI family protein, partial [Candidatus Competibacteraceae bacterium]|nr:DJ-1/PfpI family protein [Candidatus Competibacteraceae bacterium]
MAEKILIVTGDGGESYEVLYALHRFQEAGYTTDIAAPSARSLHLVQHDFEPGWDTYIERQGYRAEANISF